eukprot:GEMP01048895.1.p1 GENE.GEMP01048895.1~~GEMP01048895.1.p1  ORF type:complete len:131 (-),score=26.71 GEMP01048895.1:258-650(-)
MKEPSVHSSIRRVGQYNTDAEVIPGIKPSDGERGGPSQRRQQSMLLVEKEKSPDFQPGFWNTQHKVTSLLGDEDGNSVTAGGSSAEDSRKPPCVAVFPVGDPSAFSSDQVLRVRYPGICSDVGSKVTSMW